MKNKILASCFLWILILFSNHSFTQQFYDSIVKTVFTQSHFKIDSVTSSKIKPILHPCGLPKEIDSIEENIIYYRFGDLQNMFTYIVDRDSIFISDYDFLEIICLSSLYYNDKNFPPPTYNEIIDAIEQQVSTVKNINIEKKSYDDLLLDPKEDIFVIRMKVFNKQGYPIPLKNDFCFTSISFLDNLIDIKLRYMTFIAFYSPGSAPPTRLDKKRQILLDPFTLDLLSDSIISSVKKFSQRITFNDYERKLPSENK